MKACDECGEILKRWDNSHCEVCGDITCPSCAHACNAPMPNETKASHTPGKWTAIVDAGCRPVVISPDRSTICALSFSAAGDPDPDPTPNYEANARLIASAPDLLEACKAIESRLTNAARAFYGTGKRSALQSAFEGWIADAEQARTAISRAEGGAA